MPLDADGKMTEVDLAARVVAWLEEQRFDVYQSVQLHSGGPVADIVATQGSLVVVVEAKLRFGFKVVDQAAAWSPYAHLVYCAVPRARGGIGRAGTAALVALGVGVIVSADSTREELAPRFNRKAWAAKLRGVLCPEHKTHAPAGAQGGGHWTPFKMTCENLLKYVASHPGCPMKEAVENIDTHYASAKTARACLALWIREGKVPGVAYSASDGLCLQPAVIDHAS
jgi:hypothetical protein